MPPKFATMRDFEKQEEDEAKRENEYYTGGVDKRGGGSGQAVLGPTGDGDPVESMFRRAHDSASRGEQGPTEPITTTITMYRNGFVVNDGPFRALDDPANHEFLRDLARGRVPRELGTGRDVDVQLSDKRGEDYVPPAYVAFSGSGHSLAHTHVRHEGEVINGHQGIEIPAVDESKPTTNIQIKLINNKRIRVKVNLDQNIDVLIGHVEREGGATGSYSLLAGYPPKPLTNFSQTFQEAGLQNANITQQSV